MFNLRKKEQKTRQLRVVADEAANKASDSERKQLEATKQERESEEMNSKAVEKAAKMERLIPGVESGDAPNTNKTIADTEMSTPSPSPEPQTEPETSDTNIKSEEEKIEDTDNNPGVTPAQNFTSVYDKLAIDEEEGSMRRRRSWHRRRRWVPPRVKEEKKKAIKGEEGADAEKSDVKKGFSASFWSKVVDVKTVGDAIFKVSNIPPAIKETVDTINYPHTDGYWIGLNADFQNNFVARFRGHVNVPTNGTYTFFVTSDDGAILYVNGNAVVKNDGVKSEMGMGKGELKLDSGIADIVVDFFTGVGKSGLKVEWKGPGMEEREALSAKYVHSPKHFESLGESVTGDELKSEVSAESALAQMTQGSMQSDGVVDLRATEAELLNQVVPLTR